VLDALREMPDVPALTLAKRLHRLHPDIFMSLDATRSLVRYYLGVRGKGNRTALRDKSRIRAPRKPGNPWADLPQPKPGIQWQPVQIPGNKVLVISDIHAPYHDTDALIAALELGVHERVDTVYVNGDLIDFFSVSHWQNDPRERDIRGELVAAYEILRTIKSALPRAKLIVKGGNHEDRLERYMWVRAPDLLGLQVHSWSWILSHPECFGVTSKPIVFDSVDCIRPARFGKHLWVLHGHEFGKHQVFNPVNAARGAFMRTYECTLVGHHHQTSEHTTRTVGDRLIGTWSVGCLCDLHPRYCPINWRWNHGCALLERIQPDEWVVSNKKIIRGKIY